MIEYKYYKQSGKINFKKYLIGFILALIASYIVGKIYYIISDKYISLIGDGFNIENISDNSSKIVAGIYKILNMPKSIMYKVILLGLLFIPTAIAMILLTIVFVLLRENVESRNKFVDSSIYIVLSMICIMVSNKYHFNELRHYIELILFAIFAIGMSYSSTYYYCEKCHQKYKTEKYYMVSDYDSVYFIENMIETGMEKDKRFTKEELLLENDIRHVYHIELDKCENCHDKVVKIESKKIEVDEHGNKKIVDNKEIAKDLII